MLNNVKVGTKLIVGFMAVASIACVIGIMGINSASKLNNAIDVMYTESLGGISDIDDVVRDVLYMERAFRNMVIFNEPADLAIYDETIRSNSVEILELLNKIEKNVNKEGLPAALREIKDGFKSYADAGIEFSAMAKETKVIMPQRVYSDLRALREKGNALERAIGKASDIIDKGAETQNEATDIMYKNMRSLLIVLLIAGVMFGIAIGYFLANSISKPLGQTVKMIGELGAGRLSMRLNLDRGDEIGFMAKEMDKFADVLQKEVVDTMRKIADGDLSTHINVADDKDEIRPALKHTIISLRNLIIDDGGKVLTAAANKDLSLRLVKEYKGEYAKMKDNIDTVVQNLDEAMSQVSEAAAQVSSASGEISSGAQSLAEGSNTQASSLEEVGASLEEMSSMTKQNADNSNQAKLLASEARGAANEGDAAMKSMASAIQQIKTSSDNTAKIVKTIDEIAFQTNLLALNAAVEAARAGEAGKGFAVVAEEVRNLAMRSAEAAKNTTEMIEESVKNADGGVKITQEVAKSLGQIVDRVGKVGDLIAEIAAASNEQAQGIEQVNTAVASMNHVTQQNAANSEESASAAEELSSQAAELSNMVAAFTLSSGGGSRPGGSRRSAPSPQRRQAALSAPKVHKTPAKSAKSVNPDQLIPLDDDELSEF